MLRERGIIAGAPNVFQCGAGQVEGGGGEDNAPAGTS